MDSGASNINRKICLNAEKKLRTPEINIIESANDMKRVEAIKIRDKKMFECQKFKLQFNLDSEKV